MVSGGLGVACYGLVKSLNARNVDVMFVLPKPLAQNGRGGSGPKHGQTKRLVSSASTAEVHAALEDAQRTTQCQPPALPTLPKVSGEEARSQKPEVRRELPQETLKRITFVPVDVWLQPYLTPQQYQQIVVEEVVRDSAGNWSQLPPPVVEPTPIDVVSPSPPLPLPPSPPPGRYLEHYAVSPAEALLSQYADDLFAETERYARLALGIARQETFDVVHAHDWMTFEAAMAVSAASGKPMIVQIHSTELDRAGDHGDPRILEIEKKGMLAAANIIAVSQKTKAQLVDRYGIDPRKIEVVYNAADPEAATKLVTGRHRQTQTDDVATPLCGVGGKKQKTILFLGRLAKQKGPDLFLQAAKKVLSVEPDARFVVAGHGEMLDTLMDLAESLKISDRVTFTGFLNKKERERILNIASVYVMPSISEPFGISSLDALAHDVPVIISKQSGVAEVLHHVLKVDFWDTEDLANKILAVLHHPSLSATLREQGHDEVRQLSWDDAAGQIVTVYRQLTRQIATRRGEALRVPPSAPSLSLSPAHS